MAHRGHWAWLLVALAGALLAGDLLRVWRITNHHDLDVYMFAARRLLWGEDIYAEALPFKAIVEQGRFSMKDTTIVWPFVCSPFLAIVLAPATRLPVAAARAAWWGMNVVALVAGSWLAARASGALRPARLALVLLMLVGFEPAVITLRLGQVELLEYLLLCAMLYLLDRDRDGMAGVALGIAAAFKFTPIALVGLCIWRRRWRAAIWAIATVVVISIASFAVVGFDAIAAFLEGASIYGLGGAFAAFPYNQSFNGFFTRNLMRNAFSAPLKGLDLPWLAKALTLVCCVATAGAFAALTWDRKGWPTAPNESARRRFTSEFALAIVVLLLVSPYSQVYVFTWLLIPMIVLVSLMLGYPEASRYEVLPQPRLLWCGWGGLLVSYLLIGRDYKLFRPGLTRFVQAHYFFGALLLGALLAFWLARQHLAGSVWSDRRDATRTSVGRA